MAFGVVISIILIYGIALWSSWCQRPPFSNSFALKYGQIPYVPGWTRTPTYIVNDSNGDRIYLDVKSNAILVVRRAEDPLAGPLGSPQWVGNRVRIMFPEQRWIDVGSLDGHLICINADGTVSRIELSKGRTREIYDLLKIHQDSKKAVSEIDKVLDTSR